MVCTTIAIARSQRSTFFLRGRIGVVEFTRAVADVTGFRDLRADVIVQVAGEVQDQVPEGVSEGKRFLPELGVGERRSQFTDSGGILSVAVGEDSGEGRV